MISSKVPRDVRKYKAKTIGSFTTTQALSIVVALIVDAVLWFLILNPLNISSDVVVFVLTMFSLPIMAVGFVELSGLPFHKYVIMVLIPSLKRPERRKAMSKITKKKARKITKKRQLKKIYKENPDSIPIK